MSVVYSYTPFTFCSTGLPLARTRWVWSTFSRHSPLSSNQCHRWTSATLIIFPLKFFGSAGDWTRVAGWEASMLPLCYAACPILILLLLSMPPEGWTNVKHNIARVDLGPQDCTRASAWLKWTRQKVFFWLRSTKFIQFFRFHSSYLKCRNNSIINFNTLTKCLCLRGHRVYDEFSSRKYGKQSVAANPKNDKYMSRKIS